MKTEDLFRRCPQAKRIYYIWNESREKGMQKKFQDDFFSFFRWSMYQGYSEELFYEPKKCKWVLKEEKVDSASNIRKTEAGKKLYNIWNRYKQACMNPNYKDYAYYGAKEIGFDKNWASVFMNFYHWAVENGYEPGMKLSRKNKYQDFTPENCFWTK